MDENAAYVNSKLHNMFFYLPFSLYANIWLFGIKNHFQEMFRTLF